MTKNLVDQIHDILYRKRLSPTPNSFLQIVTENDITLHLDDYQRLMKICSNVYGGSLTYPDWLVETLTYYIKQLKVRTLLDPWGIYGDIIPIVKQADIEEVVITTLYTDVVELFQFVQPPLHINWLLLNRSLLEESAANWTEMDHQLGNYDLIISRLSSLPHRYGESQQPRETLILKATAHLSENGQALFFITSQQASPVLSAKFYKRLAQQGVHLNALLSIPNTTFVLRGIGPNALIILSRTHTDNLFVGELKEDQKHNRLVLDSLIKQRDNKEPSLGTFVNPDKLVTYRHLVLERQIERLGKRSGLSPVPLVSLVLEMHLTSKTRPEFEDQNNSVYLPLLGTSPAVTSLSDLRIKPQNYVQLVIDPEKALSSYVAGFFNTPLGELTRNHASLAGYIPKLSKKSLADVSIYLPTLEKQIAAVRADTRVTNLISDLSALREQIWSRPNRLRDTEKDIERVNKEDRFEDWLTSLPFPLASILWIYYASSDGPKEKYETLLYFFEALAEFVAIVLLSAFIQDKPVYEEQRAVLEETLKRGHLSITRSSFGTWVKVVERFGMLGRNLINSDQSDMDSCFEIFRTNRLSVLEFLFSKQLISVLQETNKFRNDWKGHAGVVGSDLAFQRLAILEAQLARVRQQMGQMWDEYVLVIPSFARMKGGVFTYQVKRIMGPTTPFPNGKVETTVPLESEQLHLHSDGSLNALPLLPLIKILASPDNVHNACYFFNRTDGHGQRFITYHFESQPERTERFQDTGKIIERLSLP